MALLDNTYLKFEIKALINLNSYKFLYSNLL